MRGIFIVFLLSMNKAFCESDLYSKNEQIENVLNHNMYEPNYFSMLLGLIFVILLIYLTGILYQKLIKVKLDNKNIDDNRINIISTTPLGQNKNIHIINVRGKDILIGSTQNSITYIKDLGDDDENC